MTFIYHSLNYPTQFKNNLILFSMFSKESLYWNIIYWYSISLTFLKLNYSFPSKNKFLLSYNEPETAYCWIDVLRINDIFFVVEYNVFLFSFGRHRIACSRWAIGRCNIYKLGYAFIVSGVELCQILFF